MNGASPESHCLVRGLVLQFMHARGKPGGLFHQRRLGLGGRKDWTEGRRTGKGGGDGSAVEGKKKEIMLV